MVALITQCNTKMSEFIDPTHVIGIKMDPSGIRVYKDRDYAFFRWIFPSPYFDNDQIPRDVVVKNNSIRLIHSDGSSVEEISNDRCMQMDHTKIIISATVQYNHFSCYSATNVTVALKM